MFNNYAQRIYVIKHLNNINISVKIDLLKDKIYFYSTKLKIKRLNNKH